MSNSPTIERFPAELPGTPDQWYANAEQMTIAQEAQRSTIDWYIRPFHQGFLVTRGSSANNATSKTKASSEVEKLSTYIDARRRAFADGRITEASFNDGTDPMLGTLPDKDLVYLNDEQAQTLAELVVLGGPSPVRRLLRIAITPPAWMAEELLLANDDNGTRRIWVRRKNGRWQMVPGSGNSSISDETMATREPAAFDAVERIAASE